MKKDNNIQEELQSISPLLAQMKDAEEGYKVPHLYFETLQDKVLAEAKQQPKKIGLLARFFRPQLALLVSIMILLAAGIFLFNTNQSTQVADLKEVSTEELAWYVNENIDDVDLLLEIDDPELNISNGIDLDPNELENYIEEEFIDVLMY